MRFPRHAVAAVIAAAALAVPAAPSHAALPAPDGCVTTYVDNRQPYLFDGIPGVDIDTQTPAVHIYPTQPVAVATYIVNNEVGMAVVLVQCIV